MRRYKDSDSNFGCGFLVLVIVVIALISIIPSCNKNTYSNLTVVEKSYSGESDGYIVWFEDADGVQYEFQNEDSLWQGKFDSSTIQGKLKEGSKYNITTIGWRIPFFSSYPNIVRYEKVSD